MPSMKWKRHRTSSAGSIGRHSRNAATKVRLDWSKLSATSCVKSERVFGREHGAQARVLIAAVAALDLGERGPDKGLDHGLERQAAFAVPRPAGAGARR